MPSPVFMSSGQSGDSLPRGSGKAEGEATYVQNQELTCFKRNPLEEPSPPAWYRILETYSTIAILEHLQCKDREEPCLGADDKATTDSVDLDLDGQVLQ
jgi:hypothetical protein